MTALHLPTSTENSADRFARRITARLSQGNDTLPYDITERLRAGRMQALARRKLAPSPVAMAQPAVSVTRLGHTAVLNGGWGNEGGNWWRAVLSAVPLMALVVGLVVVNITQNETGSSEIAQLDTALLTDDLPPAAYADPGFAQYLKTTAAQER